MKLRYSHMISVEGASFVSLLVILAVAIFLSAYDSELYRSVFKREDQFVEIFTFLILLFLGILCLWRAIILRKKRERKFTFLCLSYSLIFLFGAGEEISWGQRVLNFNTPVWFIENNKQQELNIHNLMAGSNHIVEYINIAMEVSLAIYLLFIPVGYKRWKPMGMFLDGLALPIPKLRVACLLAVSLFISEVIIGLWLAPGDVHELTELSVVYCVALIFLYPVNQSIYRHSLREFPARR